MLKKFMAISLCVALIFVVVGCKKAESKSNKKVTSSSTTNKTDDAKDNIKDTTVEQTPTDYTDPSIYTLDTLVSMGIETERTSDETINKKSQEMLKTIENRPDTLKPKSGGKYIYVANNGVDGKGYGYEADKPVATIAYANLLAQSGDVVLLKRGNFWRENVVGVEGVSYGAYGKGNKPTIYGSPKNYATEKWELDGENIYKVKAGPYGDVGLIVFDHGKACGSKVNTQEELTKDYDFLAKGGYVYFYFSKGNPTDFYSDIEFCITQHIVKIKSNSTVQNWRIMYGGAHGISMINTQNVEFDGCVIGYIGGGYQGGTSNPYTRYGNGIEIWGSCDGYIIRNCHVYQCYDAGITMQYSGNLTEENILFENNLLEYSFYNIEYFCPGGVFKNVLIQNNIVRHASYGWGFYSRPDKNRGTNVSGGYADINENFVYKNNIFDHSKRFLLKIDTAPDGFFPTFEGNTFAQKGSLRILRTDDQDYGMQKHGEMVLTDIFKDTKGKLITY